MIAYLQQYRDWLDQAYARLEDDQPKDDALVAAIIIQVGRADHLERELLVLEQQVRGRSVEASDSVASMVISLIERYEHLLERAEEMLGRPPQAPRAIISRRDFWEEQANAYGPGSFGG